MNSKIKFSIGNVNFGGDAPVVLQSMTNTDTNDVAASVLQCKRIIDAGGEMVRLTVPSLKEADALKEIVRILRHDGYKTPIVADVHFNPKVAEKVANFVDKVRINPGNFTDKRNFSQLNLSESEYSEAVERMSDRAKPLLEICRKNGTAVRVGINHGSLCDRILNKYGNTPTAMVQSAVEWMDICARHNFEKLVFSMKSSNVMTMIESVKMLQSEMLKRGTVFPIHLGVTEAGNGIEGRVKSAAGIGALLLDNIGDTIRVSLTEAPENEIVFAKKLISALENTDISNLNIKDDTLYFSDDTDDFDIWVSRAAAVSGYAHSRFNLKNIALSNKFFSEETIKKAENDILQACRIKIVNTEFVACPSCGRTQYDIQSVFSDVKERFSGIPGLKIGVMGCIVNGPGEMADADFGIVGATNGLVCVYEGKKRISEPLPAGEALALLEKTIRKSINL